jgi:hypothetical protein
VICVERIFLSLTLWGWANTQTRLCKKFNTAEILLEVEVVLFYTKYSILFEFPRHFLRLAIFHLIPQKRKNCGREATEKHSELDYLDCYFLFFCLFLEFHDVMV